MKTTLSFNGKQVKSINFTKGATKEKHSTSLLINNHVIHGFSKNDCLNLASELSFDKEFRNQVEWFIN